MFKHIKNKVSKLRTEVQAQIVYETELDRIKEKGIGVVSVDRFYLGGNQYYRVGHLDSFYCYGGEEFTLLELYSIWKDRAFRKMVIQNTKDKLDAIND